MQSRKESLTESLANVLIGYVIAVGSQVWIFRLLGLDVPVRANLIAGVWLTAISIGRSYLIRRYFNARKVKSPIV